jgi:hypothetical protein
MMFSRLPENQFFPAQRVYACGELFRRPINRFESFTPSSSGVGFLCPFSDSPYIFSAESAGAIVIFLA